MEKMQSLVQLDAASVNSRGNVPAPVVAPLIEGAKGCITHLHLLDDATSREKFLHSARVIRKRPYEHVGAMVDLIWWTYRLLFGLLK